MDLVITNEKHMAIFLNFLIMRIRTIDGNRNSANKLLEILKSQAEQEHVKSKKFSYVSEVK